VYSGEGGRVFNSLGPNINGLAKGERICPAHVFIPQMVRR
jgi:hypothetical protein